MRKILIFLIVTSMILGAASALPRFGPANGFHSKAIDVDTLTADAITAGVSITETGAIDVDTTWGAGYDILATAGDGKIDWSAATGVVKFGNGALTAKSATTWFGAATNGFNGAVSIGGALKAATILSNASARVVTLLETTDLRAADDALVDDDLFVDGTTTTQDFLSNSSGRFVTLMETTDGRAADDFLVDDDFYVDGTATIQDMVVNSTVGVNGLLTAAAGINTPTDVAAKVGGALSAKTANINTSSGLTVNSVIVPTSMTVTTLLNNRTATGRYIFTAQNGENWQVTGVSEIHTIASTATSACTLVKVHNGDTLSAATNVTVTALNMRSTAGTLVSPGISTTSGVCKVNATDSLGIIMSAVPSTMEGGVLTVNLKRIA